MPRTDSPGSGRMRSPVVGLALIVIATACQQRGSITPQGAAVGRVLREHAFGDTARHAVRVLSFDPGQELATVFLRQPGNVIVLAVQPGRDIEVIFPGGMTVKQLGGNRYAFNMKRFELVTRQGNNGISTNDRQAYEACMRDRAAAMRASQRAERARRDSTGKVVRAPDPTYEREIPLCDLMPEPSRGSAIVERPLPPRPPSERYLVVLSSADPVSLADLEERLAGLGTSAPDVVLTIEAIAAGIYVGKSESYGGTFISW